MVVAGDDAVGQVEKVLAPQEGGQGIAAAAVQVALAVRQQAQALGCCSARRLDANRRGNVLINFYSEGSRDDAEQHQVKNRSDAVAASAVAPGMDRDQLSGNNEPDGVEGIERGLAHSVGQALKRPNDGVHGLVEPLAPLRLRLL